MKVFLDCWKESLVFKLSIITIISTIIFDIFNIPFLILYYLLIGLCLSMSIIKIVRIMSRKYYDQKLKDMNEGGK